jgi:hypothetical protein
VIAVRLTPDELSMLDWKAREAVTSSSEILREALELPAA